MKRKYVSLFVTGIILFVFAVSCMQVLAGDSQSPYDKEYNKAFVNKVGEYTLYDNYAKFDGTVYEYNLDEFFRDSSVEQYEYSFAAPVADDNGISIVDEHILKIVPGRELMQTIVVRASNGDDVFEAVLNLRFVDATVFLTKRVVSWISIALILILVWLAISFLLFPFKGSVRIDSLYNGKSVTLTPKLTRMITIPHMYPVRGWIFGGGGSYVKFVPITKTYTERNGAPVRAVRIDFNDSTTLYADCKCEQGINISFLKV